MWFLIRDQREYKRAVKRYQEIKDKRRGPEHREKLLLALLLNYYEYSNVKLPKMDPVKLIRTRLEEMGIQQKEIAIIYGDAGTVSKVLNYKKRLPLSLIRICSRMLRIPADALIEEYDLKR